MVKLKDDLEGFNKVLTWDLEEYKIKVKELEIKLENKTLELEDFKKVRRYLNVCCTDFQVYKSQN